jgi:membrane protein DedA with SNARE-associated domain
VLTQLTGAITTFITNLYVTTGLVGIVVAMAIESCCIPLPSEIVMPLAGVMFATGKILSGTSFGLGLVLISLAGSLGSLLGSVVAYWIGYAGGRPLMLKYGRYVLISQHDADRADAFFRRWGSATAFFSRLLPVVRTYISLPAGITRMNFAKFCIYTFLGSFPWCVLLTFIGYKLGQNLTMLGTIFHGLDVAIVAIVVLLVVLYIWRHIHNDRKARAAQATSDASPAQMMPPQNGWNWQQPQQPQWGGQPSQPQPPFQQQGWSQVPPTPSQPGWGQPPAQQPYQPQQSGWGQPVASPPQPQPQQGWGQPPQQPQQQQGWPAPNTNDGWNGQRR